MLKKLGSFDIDNTDRNYSSERKMTSKRLYYIKNDNTKTIETHINSMKSSNLKETNYTKNSSFCYNSTQKALLHIQKVNISLENKIEILENKLENTKRKSALSLIKSNLFLKEKISENEKTIKELNKRIIEIESTKDDFIIRIKEELNLKLEFESEIKNLNKKKIELKNIYKEANSNLNNLKLENNDLIKEIEIQKKEFLKDLESKNNIIKELVFKINNNKIVFNKEKINFDNNIQIIKNDINEVMIECDNRLKTEKILYNNEMNKIKKLIQEKINLFTNYIDHELSLDYYINYYEDSLKLLIEICNILKLDKNQIDVCLIRFNQIKLISFGKKSEINLIEGCKNLISSNMNRYNINDENILSESKYE